MTTTDRTTTNDAVAGRTIRWAILGPGRIAQGVARDFAHVPDAELLAVGSRSIDRAEAFAAEHGIERAYGSYLDAIADPDVDVCYIATPHPQHLELGLAAIEAGKALLVEKTFTATLAGAERLVAAARERGVFAMEAMWTRFQPTIMRAVELIGQGAIGEVRQVQADLGVNTAYDPTDRLWDPAQGGGALLDLGVYPVSLAQYVLGDPDTVEVSGTRAESGVDAEAGLLLGYADGRAATIAISLTFPLPGGARIAGTGGWIDILPRFHHPTSLTLHRRDGREVTETLSPTGTGYAHELSEVTHCLQQDRTESAIMPLSDTLAVQQVLQQAADQLGVVLAEDPRALESRSRA